jgi:hypothetical protein
MHEQLMVRVIPQAANKKLEARSRLPVEPQRSIAVKRDVHEFLVAAPPAEFAAAFKKVLTDPQGMFGLIRVKRPAERLGLDFSVGERFQGCYSIAGALLAGRGRVGARVLGWLLGLSPVRWLMGAIEDAMLSDYAVIDELVLDPPPGDIHRLKYSYLDGTPIRGCSRFHIEPAGEGRCRVTQIFEYQEVNAIALGTFQRFGLKMHDQVVHMQIHQAAARAGAAVVSGTIPQAYA